jgi:hypothetical protein
MLPILGVALNHSGSREDLYEFLDIQVSVVKRCNPLPETQQRLQLRVA